MGMATLDKWSPADATSGPRKVQGVSPYMMLTSITEGQ
jgi:hypothetical protein